MTRQRSRIVAGPGTEPTKVVMERQVHPGAETRFQGWLRTLLDAAREFGGLEGSSVLTAVSTAIPVAMLTWVVMPNLSRLLYAWLYAGHEATTR